MALQSEALSTSRDAMHGGPVLLQTIGPPEDGKREPHWNPGPATTAEERETEEYTSKETEIGESVRVEFRP